MRNLLLPFGIPYRDWAPPKLISLLSAPTWEGDCTIVGHLQQHPIYGSDGCMPNYLGAWVQTDRGVRRLQIKELAKGKGLPSEWAQPDTSLIPACVVPATSTHVWSAICDSLRDWLVEPPTVPAPRRRKYSPLPSPDLAPEDASPEEWDYQPPDLSIDSPWYKDRVASLWAATEGRPDQASLVTKGLEALTVHRENYSPSGQKYLQVLWWEFPPSTEKKFARALPCALWWTPEQNTFPILT